MKRKFAIVLGVVMAMAMPLSAFAATGTNEDIKNAIDQAQYDQNMNGVIDGSDRELDKTTTYVVDDSGEVVSSQGFGQSDVVTDADGNAVMGGAATIDTNGDGIVNADDNASIPVVLPTIAASVVSGGITDGRFTDGATAPEITIKSTGNTKVKSYAIVMTSFTKDGKPVSWLKTGITPPPADADGNVADIAVVAADTDNVKFTSLTDGGYRIVVYALNDATAITATTAAAFETEVAGKVLYSTRVQGVYTAPVNP